MNARVMTWIAALVILIALSARAADTVANARPATQGETDIDLRKRYAHLLGPFRPSEKVQLDADTERLLIVDYLGSGDEELRDAAADMLGELFLYGRPIRASVFEKYLSKDYPMRVRLVALAYTLGGVAGGPTGGDVTLEEGLKQKCHEILNMAMECPVSPPNLCALALAMSRDGVRGQCISLVKPENHTLLVRRLLALVSSERDLYRKHRIMSLVLGFPPEIVAGCVRTWYGLQHDRTTRAVFVAELAPVVTATKGDPEKAKWLKSILGEVEKDWDEEALRGEAKKLLAELE